MIWMDFDIESFGDGSFAVKGEWPGEVWQDREGNPKEHALYRPGDVFIVDANGILRKTDNLSALILKYELDKESKNEV